MERGRKVWSGTKIFKSQWSQKFSKLMYAGTVAAVAAVAAAAADFIQTIAKMSRCFK